MPIKVQEAYIPPSVLNQKISPWHILNKILTVQEKKENIKSDKEKISKT